MASFDNQQTWVPYQSSKDCSKGFCSLYCPQWCYMVFPPPPPLEFPREDSGPNFSPLVIAIIGILASAFLLVSYYTLVSKYCGNMDSLRRRIQRDPDEEFNDSRSPSRQEPWQVASSGLDETHIKSITVCKYKKGDGLIEGTDCSVCLSEFQEDESLRLLPKCSHAFHLPCIDMWLKSHLNCPLCRASVVATATLPPQLPLPPVPETQSDHWSSTESQHESDTIFVVAVEDLEGGEEEEPSLVTGPVVPKSPLGALGDLETRIEISDGDIRTIRRSFSMDSSQDHVSIADVLTISMEEDCQYPVDVGPSKRCGGEHSNVNHRSRVLHCVVSPTAMKRSSSSERFLFTRHGRGRNAALPI